MDEAVFHHLYETYHRDVFNFLTYLTKDRQLAEDLSHEVYVKAIRAYSSFERRSSEKTWLFSIAKNVAVDHFRKTTVRKRHADRFFDWDTMEIESDKKTPEQWAVESEEIRTVLRLLDDCTTDQRLVLIMRYMNDLTIAETAASLEWSEGKVKTTQHRALKRLRNQMAAADREEDR
ncbi:sigma-70 family RNA polymerase sigma factor [Sporosarcina trichiuri]|uniref:sigma-70 family RNA polymerase sigma factor n=1 Tax=Sporosarcina trichiuri TaxID=3056445 RepID=UPI0025B41D4C|nr:sigma-70 family RNA polymerase sigma factor [Sporosarcina sp. 0.2-SM1T-5]WJY28620.1 sigma-70 family RNA polymerase sigma factor [Sporosarcina sp. 0.2-SM1T-5]